MACARYYHEEFVVVLARGNGEFLVSVASEIKRMSFLAMHNHHGAYDFRRPAHQWGVDPR